MLGQGAESKKRTIALRPTSQADNLIGPSPFCVMINIYRKADNDKIPGSAIIKPGILPNCKVVFVFIERRNKGP